MDRPKVGLAVFILNKKNEVLLGRRKGAIGDGTWAVPGGHLEFGESWEECAIRETLEETGLHISNVRFATAVNTIYEQEKKHYVVIAMRAEISPESSDEPQLMEPEKCYEWRWVSWGEFPNPLFQPLRQIAEKYNPLEQSSLNSSGESARL